MVVVDVDEKIGPVQHLGEAADAVPGLGVDEDEARDGREVDILEPRGQDSPCGGRPQKEVAKRPLLRSGEDDPGVRVELLGPHHPGQGIEVGVRMGCDDFQ